MDVTTYISTYGPQPVVVRCEAKGRMLPDADGAVATITFASFESAAGRIGGARLSARTETDAGAQFDALVEYLSSLVTGWTLPLPCEPDVVRTVLREIGWLGDHAFATLRGDADFFATSETP